jgi:hypothetical protein
MMFEDLKDFSKYQINREGVIFHKIKNKIITPNLDNGYLKLGLMCDDGKRRTFYIHRLLGLQYIDNPDNLECIDHIDRNRQNNSLDNLRWVDKLTNNNNITKNRGYIYQHTHKYAYYQAVIFFMGKRYTKQHKDINVCEEWLENKKKEFELI